MATTKSQLSVITHRTEHFSPSKRQHPYHTSSPPSISSQAVPFSQTAETANSASFQPPSQPIVPESTHSGSPPISPPTCSNSLISPTSTPAAACPGPVMFTPALSNILMPLIVTTSSHTYHVLPLSSATSLGQPPPRTQHDLILPPCGAFASALYPPFTTRDCTWQYIFDQITDPSSLWLSYAPASLGDYPDIKSLWQAWDEGAFVVDIGHKPALRLIDARWGNLKSQETHRGRLPFWRPRNNEKVSAGHLILINFSHIVHRLARSGRISFFLFTALKKR
jgi:hypothetical protein